MLYTKNGSIPKPETDGTEGWIEAPMPPDAPEGKEVVWLNWEWVVRDPKPVDREGYRWKWNHDQMQWIEYFKADSSIIETSEISIISTDQIAAITSDSISALTTDQI